MITVLSEKEGVLRAFAHGVRKTKNRHLSAVQPFSYADFEFEARRGAWQVADARPIALFFGLRDDHRKLALAVYFAELALALNTQGEDAREQLRVLLNALHYLEKNLRPQPLLKCIVETRLLACQGVAPAFPAESVLEALATAPLERVFRLDVPDIRPVAALCEKLAAAQTGRRLPMLDFYHRALNDGTAALPSLHG
jgi:DNA repair protein RecO